MVKKLIVFDESWHTDARAKKSLAPSWAHEVMEALATTGGVYLGTLRLWFDRFPLNSNKQKHALKTRLEGFNNEDHLGAVNELAWWVFMQRIGLQSLPVPTSSAPRPDFQVKTSVDFFVEVSTLNISKSDKSKFETGEAVALDHSETLRRILGKVTDEKQRQMSYAADQKQPCVLVLFDYTIWSAFATQFFRFLADFLLGKEKGFQELPDALSALVYVERKVIDGRIAVSRDRSAIYYNPNAKYLLDMGTFAALNQFWCQVVAVEPKSADHWIWL
jgi:hypothetical protein